jgi:hypothetical protein
MLEINGWNVILGLKLAVSAVSVLLLWSLIALLLGRYRLHGRINLAFFLLTLTALLALEVLVRVVNPNIFDYFDERTRHWLTVHLCFALPAAALMPIMLYTGYTRRRWLHLRLALGFAVLWIGTVVTGVFFLPHTPP